MRRAGLLSAADSMPLVVVLLAGAVIRGSAHYGHDPSKCLEDNSGDGHMEFDDDCCAVQGYASCANGYTLEWSGDSCCPDCTHNPLRYSCVPPCPYGTCSMKRSDCEHQIRNAPKGAARKDAMCVQDGPCSVLFDCLKVLMQYPSCHDMPAVKRAFDFANTTAQLCTQSDDTTKMCESHANDEADLRCPAGPALAAIEQAKRNQRSNDLGFQSRQGIKSRLTTELRVEFSDSAANYAVCGKIYQKDSYLVKVDPLDPKGTEVTPWQARDRGASQLSPDYTPDGTGYTPDVYWEPEPNKTYTLLMVDATASPALGLPGPFMLHSMFTDCSDSIKSCNALIPYMGLGAPLEEQFNYIWLLYEGSVDPTPEQMGNGNGTGYSAIMGFDVNQFAEDHGLGPAVGMNWFYSKRDETLPYIYNVLWDEQMGQLPCPGKSA